MTRALALAVLLGLAACGGGNGTVDGGTKDGGGNGTVDGGTKDGGGAVVDPVHSTVTVDRATGVVADGMDRATVSVTLVDTSGAPIAGQAVMLAATGSGNVLAQPMVTDASGDAEGTLASTVAGTKTVSATAGATALAQTPTVAFVAAANPCTLLLPSVPGPATGSEANSVTTGDFNGDGKADLATADENGNTVSVLLGHGDGTFHLARYAATDPIFITTRDLNGDGKLDLVVANPGSNTVGVFLGNGDGTFQTQVTYATGTTGMQPDSVTTGDFNGDGKPDLAAANRGSNTVSVLLGNGDGTFQTAVTLATGSYPVSVTTDDFNGDGKPDLAAANGGSNTVSVLLGNGDGTFQTQVIYTTGSNTHPFSITTGDLNGDGKPDLAVANHAKDTVSVLLGNGDGTFQNQVSYPTETEPTGLGPCSVTTGDLNGDGKLDLAVANDGYDSVSVLLGNGDGTFRTQVSYAAGPYSVTLGDFNGDGKLDLAAAPGGPNTAVVLLGKGDGTFLTAVTYATGSATWPTSVTTGDLNGDGKLDLAVAEFDSSTMAVLLGNGDGTFQSQASYATGPYPDSVTTGDFNGDGKLDLAVANYGSPDTGAPGNTVSVLLGNGDGTFQTQVSYATGTVPSSVTTGDFNGDGKPDLAVANSGSPGTAGNTVSVLLGNGDGTFQAQVTYATGTGPSSVATGDFNGDGRLDLAVANFGNAPPGIQGATVSVLLGNGDGTFQTQVTYATGSGPSSVATGDFNGDGRLDLAVANDDAGLSVLLGNGDGTFQTQATYASFGSASSVTIGDFNGDGKPDVALANAGVGVLLGNGDGTFQAQLTYEPLMASMTTTGDLNGDGKPDLVVANRFGNSLDILLNFGTRCTSSTSAPSSLAGRWPGSGTSHEVGNAPVASSSVSRDSSGAGEDLYDASPNGMCKP